MAGKLHLSLRVDLGELSRDLRAMGRDLDRPLREALSHGAEMVATGAKPLMRFRPEGAWKGSSGAAYGHIREYYEARVATLSASVTSDHPAAPVWEWGGDIHPLLGSMHETFKGKAGSALRLQLAASGHDQPPYTFHIPRETPVGRAAEKAEPELDRFLDDAVSRLLREYGF